MATLSANPFPLTPVAIYGGAITPTSQSESVRQAQERLRRYVAGYHSADRLGGAIGIRGGHGAGKTQLLSLLADNLRALDQQAENLYARVDSESFFELYKQLVRQLPRQRISNLIDIARKTIAADHGGSEKPESLHDRLQYLPPRLTEHLTASSDPPLTEESYRWLMGERLENLGQLDEPLSLDALATIAALHRLAGVPLLILIDQFEVLFRTRDRGRQASLLKKLLESLVREKALLFIAGHDEAWQELPSDVSARLDLRKPLRLGNLSIDETRQLLDTYMGSDNDFRTEAVAAIHELSLGNPRDIIRIAHRAFETHAGDLGAATRESIRESAVDSGVLDDQQRYTLHPSAARPSVANDAVGGADALNLEGQANIFAQVIVSKSLSPPLAIGLFGEWGSGKSYFMELILNAAVDESKKPGNWPGLCQVRFNAWHYMDADLWAGLAGRIFDGIAERLTELGFESDKQKPPDYAEDRKKLRERLRSTFDARREAEEATRAAVTRLQEVRRDVQQLSARRDKKLNSLKEITKTVWKELFSGVEPDAARNAAKRLGVEHEDLEAVLSIPDEARVLLTDLKSARGQVRLLANSLTPGNAFVWIVGGFVVLGPFVGQILLDWLTELQVDLSGASGAIGQVAVIGTAIMTRIRNQLKDVSTITDYATTIQEKGSEIREKVLSKLTPEQQEAYAAYEEAQAEVETAQAHEKDLERSIAATQSQLEALNAGKLVYDFVLERGAEDGTYRAREGIVSVVRRDLETLSHLLQQWKEDDPDKLQELVAKSLDNESRTDLPIQRIVLYIDDLDRCPPKRVVEVLQAVHLLLAFDLFVVVVGVDARWLERSLEGRYERLIGDRQSRDDQGKSRFHHPAASAQDYLEKIFQVPFTLPRVGEKGFGNLLKAHLFTKEEIEEKRKRDKARDEATPEGPDQDAYIPSDGSVVQEDRQPESESGPPEESHVPNAQLQDGEPREDGVAQTVGSGEEAEEYYIERWEREFMATKLHEFIGTPRLTKRFVNVYRLLRVALERDEYQDFARDDPAAGHRVVQVLLAMNVGFPRVSSVLLRAIAFPDRLPPAAQCTTWKDFVVAIDTKASHALLNELDLDADQLEELKRMHPLLTDLESHVAADLSSWKGWAPKVGRYSMYWRGR